MTNPGLEGVVVADTQISEVDGERGRLVIAGADVEQLAGAATFEATARRVLAAGGADPVVATPIDNAAFGAARAAAWELLPRLGDALDHADAMDALRTGLAHLRPGPTDAGGDLAAAMSAIGAAPVVVAAWSRRRAGQAPVAPDPALGHAADYLRMTLGRPGDAASVRALDAYLVTVIDHAMCASTFTARVIASTASDLISALVGAVGALKGPLHGGAPGPVLDMLDAIGAPDRAEAWLLGELAAGRRIMGMGHRVYRVRDPRAAVLEEAVRPLASPRLELARAVERAAAKILHERKPDRPLAANVEFYTAVLLDAVGLPREQFSATFAVSRVAGWAAHVLEQRRTGRLIRPASRYIGAMP
ncbi:MAG: citrate synthase [Deltaproteobacteria bacterium]|nr:MAG: citrate synthase [Deltaproteobacteria bacterium]TMQ10398.1 MAG: citrate synthase [Deltaproteobacteria bacterium]